MKSYRGRSSLRGAVTLSPALLILASGCTSPLGDQPESGLRESILESSRRELRDAERYPNPIAMTRESRTASLNIKPSVMPELEAMAGPSAYERFETAYGPSLLGHEQRVVEITLERAVTATVNNNLNVQFARLAPAISEAQVVAAQAAFDWTLFSNFQWNSTDEPQTTTGFGSTAIVANQRQVVDLTTGVRKRLVTGGQLTIQHEFRHTNIQTQNLFVTPNPAYDSNISLQLDQPLLRNFGSDVALAQTRLNKNSERDEIQALKATILQNVTDVEAAYWTLARARADLRILQRLLDRGEDVRIKVKNRLPVDAEPSEYSDAAARVETRRANVIRAQNALAIASDRLKVLMNSADFTVGSDVLLLPADSAIDQPITFSLLDSLQTAVGNRPEVQRAILSIDNTSIRQTVADNARLPRFDLRAQTQFSGEGGSTHGAYHSLVNDNFVDFGIGLQYEQPIGNREAEAGFRQRRFERSQAVIAYRNTIQGIVSEVTAALRNVVMNYTLIEQTRAARIAAAENLRTLQVKEELIQGLTPEFLNLKLQRQELLAAAEQDEVQALADYNTALARLYAAMGTALERNHINFVVPDVEPVDAYGPVFPTSGSIREALPWNETGPAEEAPPANPSDSGHFPPPTESAPAPQPSENP